jgi:hypothetical protein
MTRRFGPLLSSLLLALHGAGCGGKSSTTGHDSGAGESGSDGVRGGASGSGAGGASGNGAGGSPPRGGAGGEVSRGGSTTTGGGAGTSAGGNAGSAATFTGGTAGDGAGSAGVSGGLGGLGGGGGLGGVGGVGGVSGRAGTTGTGHECETAADCTLVSDCCRCDTALASQSYRPSCDAECEVDQCTEMGITDEEVACTAGRCVIARSCDLRQVECEAAPPTCAPGFVPSVRVQDPVRCWGPCLLATECDGVTDCDACPTGSVCVHDALGSKRTCIVPPPHCSPGSYCDCLAPCAVGSCVETGNELSCVCVTC